MFYRIKNDKLCDYADYNYSDECLETDIITQGEMKLHPNKVIIEGGVLVLNPNYKQEEVEKERQRIANLTMTALDFIGVLQQLGLTLQQINDYLEEHLELKMQLTYCQNVYCGVVCQLCPITVDNVTLTEEIVIQAFKTKNGEN